MTDESIFKRELIEELRKVANFIKNEENLEKQIYYLSAAYGITSRTFRYQFRPEYLLSDLVLNTAYGSLRDRLERLKSGDTTVIIDAEIMGSIIIGLESLAENLERNKSILKPLELILTASYSSTGPGNYLKEKGMLKL